MHPVDCPEWEYKDHPNYQRDLHPRAVALLRDLRTRQIDLAFASDTRRVHERLFETLTPQEQPYYAGHYRGEDYRCLRYYLVEVPGDPRVGAAPGIVLPRMRVLGTIITSGVEAMVQVRQVPNTVLPEEEKLKYAVILACRVFEEFLRIHPYANGNGHAARFLVCAIIGLYGYWPNQTAWPIDPRPPNPPYIQLIQEYRNGNVEPLEMHVLSCYL